MESLIEKYIEFKRLSWAATTLRTEESRLHSNKHLIDMDPKDAFVKLRDSGMKPYAIKTTMIRIGTFYQWLLDSGHRTGKNRIKEFMRTHENLFKYAYSPQRLTITYDEAARRIEKIPQDHLRNAAKQLLSGLRSCELKTVKDGQVIGKGQKPREVYLPAEVENFRYKGSYGQLYYSLKKVGLTPHMLRKLCASEFSRLEGVTTVDILESFGWNSVQTAMVYLQPLNSSKRSSLFKKVREA